MHKFGLRVTQVGPHAYGNWTRDGILVAFRGDTLVELEANTGQTLFDVPAIETDTLSPEIQAALTTVAKKMAAEHRPKIKGDITP